MTRPPTRTRHPARGDRGALAVELVICAPVLVLFILLVVAFGRMAQARGQVEGAAADAARAASLARLPGQAGAAASDAAASTLAGGPVSCRSLTVALDAGAARPGGSVRATVTCVASLSGMGLAGSKTFTASSVAPIETYRAG